MGLFSKLKDAIFSKLSHRKSDEGKSSPNRPPAPESAQRDTAPAQQNPSPSQSSQPQPAHDRLTAAELATHLDNMEKANPEDLTWRKSIVDLMKLVGMDSSYASRKEMAIDLGYKPEDIDAKGSAEMNIWLHKEVLKKLSEDTDGDLSVA